MANIVFSPKFRVEDSTGAPLASGKVYFYTAGTSTPKDTYADSGAVTPNANPVVLDSRGEATIYGTGSYKIVVKDSADATIYTVDNYKISGTVATADIEDLAVTTGKLAANVLSADATGRGKMQDGFVTSAKLDTGGVALPSGSTATTQSTGDSTTKVATTAFVAGEFTDKTASQAEMEAASSTADFVTPGRAKYAPSAAKAWGHVDCSAGTGYPVSLTVNASNNVASATKTAQGTYKVTFTTAMSSAYYAPVVSIVSATPDPLFAIIKSITATDFTFVIWSRNDGSGEQNADAFTFSVFGDI